MNLLYKKNIFLLFLSITLGACYTQLKLTTAKTIRVIDISVFTTDTVNNTSYLHYYPLATYKNSFITELKNGLKEGGLTVVDTGLQITDYTVVFTKLSYKESLEPETVKDANSVDNGKTFPLHACSIKAESSLYNANAKLLEKFTFTNYQAEKLRPYSAFWNLLFETNNTEYRIKKLSNNIFDYIAKACARSTSAAVIKKLLKTE